MRIVGTHDEITYILSQCSKRPRTFCQGCVLERFCGLKMFLELSPSQLNVIETGRFEEMLLEPTLIPKGDDKNGNQVQ